MSNKQPESVAQITILLNDDNTISVMSSPNLDLSNKINILSVVLDKLTEQYDTLMTLDSFGQLPM